MKINEKEAGVGRFKKKQICIYDWGLGGENKLKCTF